MANIGQIGDVLFEYLRGPESFSRTRKWEHSEHAIAGGASVLEYTGRPLETVSLKIRLAAAGAWGWSMDPQEELSRLENMGDDGVDYPLIIGVAYLGMFVVESVKIDYKRFNRDGKLLSADVGLKLREYN